MEHAHLLLQILHVWLRKLSLKSRYNHMYFFSLYILSFNNYHAFVENWWPWCQLKAVLSIRIMVTDWFIGFTSKLYCKRGNFCMGIISFFRYCELITEISLMQNNSQMILITRTVLQVLSWKLSHMNSLINIFVKFSPSEYNHVYNNLSGVQQLYSSQSWQKAYFLHDCQKFS